MFCRLGNDKHSNETYVLLDFCGHLMSWIGCCLDLKNIVPLIRSSVSVVTSFIIIDEQSKKTSDVFPMQTTFSQIM